MDRITYQYPLLNEQTPDTTKVEQITFLKANKFIEVPLIGDGLCALEFPDLSLETLNNLKITLTQGGIVYTFTLSVQTALAQRVEFQGLGIPLGLADKHPLQISFSNPLQFVRLVGGSINDHDWRSVLYRGSRYRTKKIYWTVHHGQVLYTQDDDWRITKFTNKHRMINTDRVYNIVAYDDIRPYIKNRLLPACIYWSPKPLKINGKLCYKVVLPTTAQEIFSKWCEEKSIKILNPWLPLVKRGEVLLSAHDAQDNLIVLLKKYHVPYRVL